MSNANQITQCQHDSKRCNDSARIQKHDSKRCNDSVRIQKHDSKRYDDSVRIQIMPDKPRERLNIKIQMINITESIKKKQGIFKRPHILAILRYIPTPHGPSLQLRKCR